MDTLPTFHPGRGQRAKVPKSSQFTLSHQSNYIDAEPPPDVDIYGRHREPRSRRREADHFPHHEHYVYLYIGPDQKWHARASPYFQSVRKDVLTQVLPLLKSGLSAAGARDEVDEQLPSEYQPQTIPVVEERPRQSAISYPFNTKRRRMNSESVEPTIHPGDESRSSDGIVVVKQHRSSKSLKGKSRSATNMITILPSQKEKVNEWFTNAFKAIQQTACRSIAKEWIKTIHPKKQSTHPYNGNMPRSAHRSPERTRPPYWPHDVRHKEPDHIDKTARTKLLVHLIQNTPQAEIVPGPTPSEKQFTARDLLTVLEQKQDESVMPKIDIVREIVDVRELLEKYDEGGMDPASGIHVTDYGSLIGGNNAKKKKNRSEDLSRSDDEGENADPNDDNTPALTPNVSISEDNTLESVHDHASMDITSSFYSTTSSQDDVKAEMPTSTCTVPDQYQQHAASQHQSYPYNVPYSRNGSMTMHVDHHGQPIQFISHHGMPHDPSYGHTGWSLGPTSAGVGLNSSFDDNVLSYPTPVSAAMSQPPYEETLALRLRNDHGMVPQTRFSNAQFAYAIDDVGPRNYHMPGSIQHDYENTGIFYAR